MSLFFFVLNDQNHSGLYPDQPSFRKISSLCSNRGSVREGAGFFFVSGKTGSHHRCRDTVAILSEAPLTATQNRLRSAPEKVIAASYFSCRMEHSVPRFFQGGGLGLRRGIIQVRLTSGTRLSSSAPTGVVITSTLAPESARARIAGIE